VVVLTLLMIQLQSFSRVFLVLLTAPLGLIGVTIALLLFNQPFGFVAMLGTIALSGMIMRNSVILIDQIEQDKETGMSEWQAIIESTIRRFRPITLTAGWADGCCDYGWISRGNAVNGIVPASTLCRML